MKRVKAVAPYIHPGHLNFKTAPYEAWVKLGGQVASGHYPPRLLHGLAFRYELPTLPKKLSFLFENCARLRFVSGYSINFDTFPDYAYYEVIPFIWDCWPGQVDEVAKFIASHHVRTAIFTSSQTAKRFQELFPNINIMFCPEGVNVILYNKGKDLVKREIDILEVGRKNGNFFKAPLPSDIKHIKTGNFTRVFQSDEEFREAMANTKVTIAVPRCDVDKEIAGGIETLTQRYWECMLSRMVMVGRAPQELIDIIGYNPVVNWDGKDASPLVMGILNDIDRYQELVDRNFDTALKYASWNIRIKSVMNFLEEKGYNI